MVVDVNTSSTMSLGANISSSPTASLLRKPSSVSGAMEDGDVAGCAPPPAAAVIIVTYNAQPHIARVLECVLAQTYGRFEIIIWDNASTDGTLDAIAPFLDRPNLQLVAHDENLGFAAGNNRAVELTNADVVVLLNPDAFPAPNWLEHMVRALDLNPDIGMVGAVQRDAVDRGLMDGLGDVYHMSGQAFRGGYGKPKPARIVDGEIFGPCGAAALYRRQAWAAAGGFDERFFCYHEDVDLAFRLRLMGWRAVIACHAWVDHVGSASTSKRSPFSVYHGVRNRLWTYVKCMPWPLLLVTWPIHVALTLALLARDAVKDRPAFRAGVRGFLDGLKGVAPYWRDRKMLHGSGRASLGDIAGAMTWSPLTLVKRAPDIRAIQRRIAPDFSEAKSHLHALADTPGR